ncbi:MAG: exo-alpha-sialidase [Rhodospirillales bacterium]|nr:exo-alpha-sialidase [Rhodospirillales bacterium]
MHVEFYDPASDGWHRGPSLNDGRTFAAIQPCLLTHPGGETQMLCRTRQATIGSCRSQDGGKTWSPLEASELPNPDSGIDAVNLASGHVLLVYNHSQTGRSPLNLAISSDGKHWSAVGVLEDEPGEFSYPAIIMDTAGRVHVTYTWNRRRIRHVAFLAEDIRPLPMEHGMWPAGAPKLGAPKLPPSPPKLSRLRRRWRAAVKPPEMR